MHAVLAALASPFDAAPSIVSWQQGCEIASYRAATAGREGLQRDAGARTTRSVAHASRAAFHANPPRLHAAGARASRICAAAA